MKTLLLTALLLAASATADARPQITGGNLPPIVKPRVTGGPLPPEVGAEATRCRVEFRRICWIR